MDELTGGDFSILCESARAIEKNALAKTQFKGPIELKSTIDFYPEDMLDLGYADAINIYERVQKIIRTSTADFYAPSKAEGLVVKRSLEIEQKVRRITVEEVKEIQKPVQAIPVVVSEIKSKEHVDLEFETQKEEPKPSLIPTVKTEDESLSFEKEESEQKEEKTNLDLEIEHVQENLSTSVPTPKPVKISEPSIQIPTPLSPIIEKSVKTESGVPDILKAQEHATAKYGDVESYFTQEWGGQIDETKIKRKMLDLTKELFKEKSSQKRDQIKLEIVVLKNMLSNISQLTQKTKSKKTTEQNYTVGLFDTIVNTQAYELRNSADNLTVKYKKSADSLKMQFYDKIKLIDDMDQKSKLYENFVNALLNLNSQAKDEITKTSEYLLEKHKTEVDTFLASNKSVDKATLEKADARKQAFLEYLKNLSSTDQLVTKYIESIIESTSSEISSKETAVTELSSITSEINSTDEGTMLYYLHSNNPTFYKKYERGHLTKSEAIQYSKILMAKEKGLNADEIKKYFGDISSFEGE
ncbi:MAG: hypothetical protein AABX38_02675 [Candidatus Micrarchaeota archaeon]